MPLSLKTAYLLVFLLVSTNVFCVSAGPNETGNNNSIVVDFESYAGDQPLQLDSVTYRNEMGQEYVVTKLKYYISHLHLTGTNGVDYSLEEHFLINEQNPGSNKITLNDIPAGEYSSVRFILGVDSLHNCSGIQSGALDPIHGMFWAWNTGYIFFKLEGRSPESKSNGNIIEYHIGGFKEPANCIRNINLAFGDKPLRITGGNSISVKIKTDISQAFKSPYLVDFSTLSAVTDMHNATLIADNYADMFSIIEIVKR
jgi:hypothetical protein